MSEKTFAAYVQRGDKIDYTNGTGELVRAGQVVFIGDAVGIAGGDIAVNATGAVAIEGVYSFPNGSAAIEAGKPVFLGEDGKCTETKGDTPRLGHTIAKAEANGTVLVRLNV